MRLVVAIAMASLMILATSCTQHDARTNASSPSASAQPKTRPTTNDYRRYMRGSVGAFSSSRVVDWDSPDPSHVVVWTSPAEAYLLTLFGACFGLQSAQTILLAAQDGVVRPGEAAVSVGPEHCRIQFVDRLDAKAMKADGLR